MATSKSWPRILEPDPEKPGPWKSWTLKHLDPEKAGPEKAGPWKTWTMNNVGSSWMKKKDKKTT